MKKRRTTKRLLAILLALTMCLSLLPMTALAEELGLDDPPMEDIGDGTENDDVLYPLEDEEEEPEEGPVNDGVVPMAAEDGATWDKVEWSEIVSGGTYAITMTVSANGITYILPNAAASKNPAAASVEPSGDTLTADDGTYGWTFVGKDDGYTISNGKEYLSPAYGKTNGVRVADIEAVWKLNSTGNYLSTPDTSDSSKTWCMGVWTTTPDWRTYTTDPTNNNIKEQTLTIWHLSSETSITPPAEPTQVGKVEAAPASGSTVEAGSTVTLSCATSGVTYQTSTDGTAWTSLTGNTFTIPADATGTYSIKAKAIKDGLTDSPVLELTYKILDTSAVSTIAEARAGKEGDTFTVSGTVTFIDGKGVYIQDETAGIDLFLKDARSDIKRGNKVTGYGTYTLYNKLVELGDAVILSVAEGTLPEPKEILISEINESVESQLIKVVGAKVTDISGTTVTLSQGEGDSAATTTIYRCPTVANLTVGDTVTVTAVVSRYNAFQLRVNSAADVVITDDVTPDPDPEEPEPERPTELYKPADGEKFALYSPSGMMVMTGEASGTRLKGKEASASGETLYTSDALILTAAVDGDGYYTFTTDDGRVLNTNAAGDNLTLAAAADVVCGKWDVTKAAKGDGWLIRSTEAEKSNQKNRTIEVYQGNFTTFGLFDTDDQTAYTMLFYSESNVKTIDWDVDADVEQTIAQWGGALKAYDNANSVTSISGDLIAVGDELDTASQYTVVKKGAVSMPLAASTAPNYYMGGTGLGKGDYAQFATSSKGWGGMTLSFRLRVTKAGASEWQVQYSSNGTDFANFSTGNYSVSGTLYTSDGQEAATREGKITNGVVPASQGLFGSDSIYYISVTLDVPVGAENADQLYIRLVSGDKKISGDGDPSGNIRVDSVKLVGSPIVSDSVTPYVEINPDNTEDVGSGAAITLTSAPGATVYYGWADNATGAVTYVPGIIAIVPAELPATLFTYAVSTGKDASVVRKMTYQPASVAAVVMSPSSAGVYLNGTTQYVTLTTATEGATIYYSLGEVGDDDNLVYQVYDPETTSIPLAPGFGSLTVYAYAEKAGFTTSGVTSRTYTERATEKYQLFFGQMHSHTSYSDGAGTAAQAFESVRNLSQETWNMDFLSVTDHSNSFDDAGGSKRINDVPTGQEWTEGKKLASDITTDGSFVGIFGYEMTWSNGLGHINTFNTPGYQDRTQTNYTTYSTALQNYYAELKTAPGSISQFNHPGTTFGDFSDFAHYDEEIDQLITLIEVGNGEGAIGSSGYFPSYEYYTRALDKGWHVAPTNNQDNHKGGWGTSNTGRDVVLVDELTEQAIYDAMRNYRVYATEDLNLEIYYTFDGNIMGTILDKDGYGAGSTATISVELNDPNNETAKVEVIVNGGKVLTSQETKSGKETVTFEIANPADYSYYYIKVTQSDGDIAVTAPVWVGAVEAVGITSLTAENAITVAGTEQSFTLELYNNENAHLEVESIVFTDKATGKTLHTATDVTRVPKMGTATTSFSYTFTTDGSVTVLATVRGTLKDVEKVYTQELELKVMPQNVVSRIIVDGSHYNDYVTGYYGGRMGNMTTIAAGLGVEVVIAREVTAELLENCQLLLVSAPARKSGTDNAGAYVPSAFEDSFIELVKNYVQSGGSVVVCGLADYQDKGATSADNHAAAQMNKLLAAIGSTMSINDDEAYDEVHNGGQAYRLYPETFNMASKWCKGIITPDSVAEGENYQTYSQYSGSTVNPGSGTWLVKGFDTTYSIDSDEDGLGGVTQGNAYFMACEDTVYGGTIFVAGAVCFSNFEVAAELDNIWDLPYANRTIFENILSMVREGAEITPIAETRKAPLNKVFAIEGYVTSGTTNPNTTFFDSIYVQDETGGTDVFPYATTGLAIGTKVRVLGYTDAYQGDRELQVINLEVLDAEPKVYEPTSLTTAQATDYAAYGGLLVSVTGKVSDIVMAGGRISQFKVTDDSNTAATVFIDGYITNLDGVNDIHTWIEDGQTVSAVGLLYSHPEGDSDESVPVLRVRNCDEIVFIKDADTPVDPTPDPNPDPVLPVPTPGGSGGPSVPSTPGTPSKPVEPTEPVEPEQPTEPTEPTEPEQPSTGSTLHVPAAPAPEQVSEIIAPYTDVNEGDWYAEYAAYMISSGMMSGTDANSFSPNAPLTRGMLVTILHRAAGQPASAPAAFGDVASGSWYANGVAWASSSGLVNGYGDGTFNPNGNISRQELAVILWRYAQTLGVSVAANGAAISGFNDIGEVASWAAEAMSWACQMGIITGRDSTHLAPNGGASRAETAAMLVRFLNLVAGSQP